MRNKRVFLLIILTACFFGVKNVWAADDELGAKIEAALKAHQGGNSASVSSPQDMIDASSDPDLRGKTETVADVNIRNAEISEIGKGQVRLTFDVENSMALQSGLVYGLELYKVLDDNKGNLLADSKVFGDDKLTIEQNGAVSRTVDYQIPDYLTGRFILWLKIKDESGLILAQQSFNASSTGTGQYIELGNPCYLSIDGENPPQQYALDRGVDLRKDEKLFLNCQAHNYASATLETIPSFEVHQRDSYGPMVNSYVEGYENVTLAGGADTLMRIAINLPENPQAYDVKVVLKKKEGKNVISNPVIAHFVITGKSGTIVNASLNKNTYQSGESAQLSLLWAGSADTFSGARMTGNYLVDPSFEVEFKGQDGAVCSQKASYKADDFKTVISMPIQNNCPYPIVSIKLIDEGVVLSSKTINAEPDKGKKGEANGTDRGVLNKIVESKLFILFITIIMLLIILIWIRRNKKRNSGGNMTDASNSIKGLLVILAISSFFWANRASATTDTLYATPFVLQLQDASAYGASFVSMSQCGLDPYSVPLCPWNYWTTSYCRFNVKALWYAPWNGIYGCYQDIVSFTYGLSSTSVSQGSTITASGSSNGVNICNNGVTVGMAMTRYDGDSAWWVIPNTYYNNSNPNASGSYSFSTSGWGCGGYRATVGYAMAHGYSSDVTQNYESYGQGTINYNVNNCCSAPTCATGPGCRTSLANGFSNPGSGTCCSGSCYLCNTNMYWNGSMCTADCSAWSLSLVASPASGSAPLTVNLTANVNAAFGGETYIYSSQSCGSGGPAPINISGNRFTCVYTSAGTYYPSVSARAQSTSCVNSGSATVAVGAAPINASCGLAATTYSSAATAFAGTFCSPGSASPASPAFPAQGSSSTWTCVGSGGGSNATCTASRALPAVNGVCGPAASTYPSSAVAYAGVFCNPGTANPISPVFPAQGASTTWTCAGSGGGSMATCTASRSLPPVNGVCGTAATTYISSATTFSGTLCNPGTASPASPAFPAQGASVSWTCLGSSGGVNASCTATRSIPPPTLSFTADSSSLVYNAATNLRWTTTNATSCWALGDWTGWQTSTGGSANTGNLTASKTYLLECWSS